MNPLVLLSMPSAIATSAQRDAKEAKCTVLVRDYEHNTATTEQRQHYADCINLVQPSPLTGGEILLIKAAILCAMVGAVLSVWANRNYDNLVDSVISFVMGAAGGALVSLLCYGVFAAVKFLFTA